MEQTRTDIEWKKLAPPDLFQLLQTSEKGLSSNEVVKRTAKFGLNLIHPHRLSGLELLIRQFTNNPLILILVVATSISYLLGQQTSSYYIFTIILASIILGWWNEFSAARTVQILLKSISLTAIVIREGQKQEIPVPHITLGDIVMLVQGSIVPADLRLLETNNLSLNESTLTGESMPVLKDRGTHNLALMGTSVDAGSGSGVVIRIGKQTSFGQIAKSTTFLKPVTEFQKGLQQFGRLITIVILLLTIVMFVINTLLGHNILTSLLFALAIAVGLTPELLPVIVTVSLAHGAGKLAKKHVIAKQLIAIENLGNMDILCTDKTGTLTEGTISVKEYMNEKMQTDPFVFTLGLVCNSAIVHHKIIGNPIDVALWEHANKHNISLEKTYKKMYEEPFDYTRKAMFCVVNHQNKHSLIVKGAPDTILQYCKNSLDKKKLQTLFHQLNNQGLRLICLAVKTVEDKESYAWSEVKDMDFTGYISFLDVPKHSTKEALEKLKNLHVSTKIITGDNELVTEKICQEIGMPIEKILTGVELEKLSDNEFKQIVETTTIFARMNPQQKLKIIKTLQALGHTVGYLGDGVNDLPSLHSADVGISVNTAIDVAKDAAALVLLHKNLHVIADGIVEGRKTFNNTIKYILMSTSSNFGNMFSAAGASFLLPFLPMTPVQILLTNGLYDISQLGIPSDNVDHISLLKPKHWNISFIRKYMLFFGPISSLFDFVTFGILFFIFHANANPKLFQTGWFMESIATEILVVFIIRTSFTPFFLSRPGKWLLATSLSMVCIGLILPFTPLAATLGFVSPARVMVVTILLITAIYITLVEIVKHFFLRKYLL